MMRAIQTMFAFLLLTAGSSHAIEPAEPNSERPALLKKLDGQWIMSGDVLVKPVKYDMQAFPTLQGRFTELHMNDVQVPSQYEARVFIGADKDGEIIAHWLDSFGAMNSVPPGTGRISEESISFNIPYASGTFRDKMTYKTESDSWKLTIEGQSASGAWEHFAQYSITRKPDQL